MPDKFETQLTVNGKTIKLNEMAHTFLTNMVVCAVSMLKGGEQINTLTYNLEGDNVNLSIDNKKIPLSIFPKTALTGAITGIVNSLKGVDSIKSLHIEMKAM